MGTPTTLAQSRARPTTAHARPGRAGDLVATLVLAGLPLLLLWAFQPLLTSPLWFDEAWRAYHVALPGLHLGLATTYAPLAVGWLLVEKLSITLLGAHEWALRLPSVAAWVLLGPASYELARRLMSRGLAFAVSAALVANPAMIDDGLELKAYIVETLVTVLIVLAWLHGRTARPGTGSAGTR